ncbi:hypothetical protein EST38_g8241 [Candolleomyces aberdarensis]|uniref:Uncharacterized protein n=1 Tax=Candolleomyces aberdarensis TaxID=2316362 RepID=A0A4Q2DEV9_9AGAR|nr:hypothetical protein EST38_g8241 [Candolleomyces aberdarensis]
MQFQLPLLFALFSLVACTFAVQSVRLDLGARDITLSQRESPFNDPPVDLRSLTDWAPSSSAGFARSTELEERVREIVVRELLSQFEGDLKSRDLVELDPRWAQAVASGVEAAIKGIVQIVQMIKAQIEKDKKLRAQFTVRVIQEASQRYPGMHFVVCGVKHRMKNLRGKFVHHVVKFKKSIGLGSFKYDVYGCQHCEFNRMGDGSLINWAYTTKGAKRSGNKVVY